MVIGNVERLDPIDSLLPHLVGAPRKDVDVVAGALQSLQRVDHRPVRLIVDAFREKLPPSLIRGHLGMALGVEPLSSMINQRDRAVQVCDYDIRLLSRVSHLMLP
jgi:hypothetical protein